MAAWPVRRTALLAGFVVLLGVAVATAQHADAGQPAVSVKPVSGPPGTVIAVTGTGFVFPASSCTLRFGGTDVGTCTVNQSGTLTGSFPAPSRKAGVYQVQACNYCGVEFEHTAQAPFTLTAPPTTSSTSGSTTSTTKGGTSTTSGSSTTSTTAPVPLPPGLPPPTPGLGIPDLGPAGGFTPIRVLEDAVVMPDIWLQRCGAPPRANVVDFDDQVIGALPRIGTLGGRFPGPIVRAERGTYSAPNAALATITPSNLTSTFIGGSAGGFTYFGMMVGVRSDLPEPIVVELAATGLSAGTVDIDRVVLGPGPSPATTCLLVTQGDRPPFSQASIRAYSTTPTVPIELLVDHVFWSTNQSYPIEPAIEQAEVEILFPRDGQRLSTARRTGVIGRVRWPASLELRRVNVSAPSWDRRALVVREATLSPTRTIGADRSTAEAWFSITDVEVASGDFDVGASAIGPGLRGQDQVTATGLGLPTPPSDEYRELADGTVDVIPWAIEPTQAIHGPLVAQRPGSSVIDDIALASRKRTIVRAYAVQQLEDTSVRAVPLAVDGLLYGSRDGVALPGSPLVPAVSPVGVTGGEATGGGETERLQRSYEGRSFNFALPYEWTAPGKIDLRFEVNPPGSLYHVDERRGAEGANSSITTRIQFEETGRVGVTVMNVEYFWRCTEEMTDTDDTRHPCFDGEVGDVVSATGDDDDVRRTLRDWWKMLPAAGEFPAYYSISDIKIPHRDDSPRVSVPDPRISGRAATLSWETWRNAFWDLYCDRSIIDPTRIRPPSWRDFVMMSNPWPAPTGIGGCAWVNNRSAFISQFAGSTAAQEASHTMGLRHTGTSHGELDGGSAVVRFPDDHGQIDPPGQLAYGFDTATMSVVRQERTTEHVHDYMSYGPGARWTSLAVWNAMYAGLRDNTNTGEPRGDVTSGGPGGEERSGAPAGERPSGDVAQVLVVTGMVDDEGVHVATPYLASPGGVVVEEGDDVAVELIGAGDASLGSAATGLTGVSTHAGEAASQFAVELPVVSGATRLVVSVDGDEPVTVVANGAAPTIEITDVPSDGDGTVRWDATGVDGGFTVEVSNDDGATWWTLGTTDETELELDRELSALVGDGWKLRVQASDGVRVATAERDAVDLGIAEPIAGIVTPRDGAWALVGMTRFEAQQSTIGDDGSAFTWSVDGDDITTGPVADLPLLEAGTHTVKLTVKNKAGSATAEIEVNAGSDVDADALIDAWEDANGLDPEVYTDAGEDPDEDGLATGEEMNHGTKPNEPDTDGDGYSDGREILGGGDPLDPDSTPGPIHGLEDGQEVAAPDVPADDDGAPIGLIAGVAAVVLAAAAGGGFLWRKRSASSSPSAGEPRRTDRTHDED